MGVTRRKRRWPKDPRNALKKRMPDLFDGTDDVLNIKERLFVLHFNANGGNAAQAARDAGYAVGSPSGYSKDRARVKGSILLSRPVVQEAIRALQASTTRELGDVALALRIRTLDIFLSDATDRVPAGRLLAEMTAGALVPKEVKVDAKMTYADMVLAAQRKREGEGETVATGDVATSPVLPDAGPALDPEPAG